MRGPAALLLALTGGAASTPQPIDLICHAVEHIAGVDGAVDLNSPGSTRPTIRRFHIDLAKAVYCSDDRCEKPRPIASTSDDVIQLENQRADRDRPAHVITIARDGWDYLDSTSGTATTPAVTISGDCHRI